jgi:hypothetical protein
LFKDASSHWVNEQKLAPGRFSRGRGHGAFSVSESAVSEVAGYIASQEEQHQKRGFTNELKLFVQHYGLQWREETVKTVSFASARANTRLKQAVNEEAAGRV